MKISFGHFLYTKFYIINFKEQYTLKIIIYEQNTFNRQIHQKKVQYNFFKTYQFNRNEIKMFKELRGFIIS